MSSSRLNITVRVLVYWLLFIGLLMLMVGFLQPVFPARYERFVYGIGNTIGTFLLTFLFIRFEKKSWRDYGLVWEAGTLFRFFKGLLYGGLIFAGLLALLVAAGGIRVSLSPNWTVEALFWYLPIIPLAIFEEVAFRSYPFIQLNKKFSFLITQLIVAVAFALYHISMGWDITVSLLGPGIWALVFGLGAVWSKGIALPTGLHVALNLAQTVVGMREESGAIWMLNEDPAAALLPANTVGMIGQVAVGVVALILTIKYRGSLKLN
jgi:uncharacterized protein